MAVRLFGLILVCSLSGAGCINVAAGPSVSQVTPTPDTQNLPQEPLTVQVLFSEPVQPTVAGGAVLSVRSRSWPMEDHLVVNLNPLADGEFLNGFSTGGLLLPPSGARIDLSVLPIFQNILGAPMEEAFEWSVEVAGPPCSQFQRPEIVSVDYVLNGSRFPAQEGYDDNGSFVCCPLAIDWRATAIIFTWPSPMVTDTSFVPDAGNSACTTNNVGFTGALWRTPTEYEVRLNLAGPVTVPLAFNCAELPPAFFNGCLAQAPFQEYEIEAVDLS